MGSWSLNEMTLAGDKTLCRLKWMGNPKCAKEYCREKAAQGQKYCSRDHAPYGNFGLDSTQGRRNDLWKSVYSLPQHPKDEKSDKENLRKIRRYVTERKRKLKIIMTRVERQLAELKEKYPQFF